MSSTAKGYFIFNLSKQQIARFEIKTVHNFLIFDKKNKRFEIFPDEVSMLHIHYCTLCSMNNLTIIYRIKNLVSLLGKTYNIINK